MIQSDHQRELDALIEILAHSLMADVAAGEVPDELRHLDLTQAAQIARVLAPRVLQMTLQMVTTITSHHIRAQLESLGVPDATPTSATAGES